MKKLLVTVLFAMVLVPFVCSSESDARNVSSFDMNRSHNMGRNCMQCHTAGGPGKGSFVVAGTVFKQGTRETIPNVTVNLYTEPSGGGKLVATIEGDARGNFFTTDPVDFGQGLYPQVMGDGNTRAMSSPISMGACNSCHTAGMSISLQ